MVAGMGVALRSDVTNHRKSIYVRRQANQGLASVEHLMTLSAVACLGIAGALSLGSGFERVIDAPSKSNVGTMTATPSQVGSSSHAALAAFLGDLATKVRQIPRTYAEPASITRVVDSMHGGNPQPITKGVLFQGLDINDAQTALNQAVEALAGREDVVVQNINIRNWANPEQIAANFERADGDDAVRIFRLQGGDLSQIARLPANRAEGAPDIGKELALALSRDKRTLLLAPTADIELVDPELLTRMRFGMHVGLKNADVNTYAERWYEDFLAPLRALQNVTDQTTATLRGGATEKLTPRLASVPPASLGADELAKPTGNSFGRKLEFELLPAGWQQVLANIQPNELASMMLRHVLEPIHDRVPIEDLARFLTPNDGIDIADPGASLVPAWRQSFDNAVASTAALKTDATSTGYADTMARALDQHFPEEALEGLARSWALRQAVARPTHTPQIPLDHLVELAAAHADEISAYWNKLGKADAAE